MAAFDPHRPPEQAVIDRCVHCGFCLDTCPTYALWANEADSPRGRIVLASEGLQEGSVLSEQMVTHFDRCLGCMACVTACPSGVQYDHLIERIRPQVERHHRRSARERALRRVLFETLPHPRRLRVLAPLLGAARAVRADRLPGPAGRMVRLAPRPPSRQARREPLPGRTAAVGAARGRVALLLGCVQRVFYPDVHRVTIQALAAEGYEVLAPALPECCGALELHSGREEAALARARATIAAFDELGVDHVLTSAAGCGSAMKDYGYVLDSDQAREFSARVKDVLELLGSVEPHAPRGPVALKVAYHDPCHLAHAQGVRTEPRALLRAIPGLELLEVPVEREICCGSAGLYNLLQPEAAAELGRRKAGHILETGAEAIAAANPGCSAQLEAHLQALGRPLPVYHPIELVWRSIQSGT
ncbi:MAG TPA: heterodisulfide reductase-related iron-sulfur binding cluster [Solirubrobacteraceae bacterium]|jgi:glycolate oxidase iron-sulfur subunit